MPLITLTVRKPKSTEFKRDAQGECEKYDSG